MRTPAALLTLACGWLVVMHDTRWAVSLAAGVSGVGMGLAFSSMVNLVVNGVSGCLGQIQNGNFANFSGTFAVNSPDGAVNVLP